MWPLWLLTLRTWNILKCAFEVFFLFTLMETYFNNEMNALHHVTCYLMMMKLYFIKCFSEISDLKRDHTFSFATKRWVRMFWFILFSFTRANTMSRIIYIYFLRLRYTALPVSWLHFTFLFSVIRFENVLSFVYAVFHQFPLRIHPNFALVSSNLSDSKAGLWFFFPFVFLSIFKTFFDCCFVFER